jgi:hypothetical protein
VIFLSELIASEIYLLPSTPILLSLLKNNNLKLKLKFLNKKCKIHLRSKFKEVIFLSELIASEIYLLPSTPIELPLLKNNNLKLKLKFLNKKCKIHLRSKFKEVIFLSELIASEIYLLPSTPIELPLLKNNNLKLKLKFLNKKCKIHLRSKFKEVIFLSELIASEIYLLPSTPIELRLLKNNNLKLKLKFLNKKCKIHLRSKFKEVIFLSELIASEIYLLPSTPILLSLLKNNNLKLKLKFLNKKCKIHLRFKFKEVIFLSELIASEIYLLPSTPIELPLLKNNNLKLKLKFLNKKCKIYHRFKFKEVIFLSELIASEIYLLPSTPIEL